MAVCGLMIHELYVKLVHHSIVISMNTELEDVQHVGYNLLVYFEIKLISILDSISSYNIHRCRGYVL